MSALSRYDCERCGRLQFYAEALCTRLEIQCWHRSCRHLNVFGVDSQVKVAV